MAHEALELTGSGITQALTKAVEVVEARRAVERLEQARIAATEKQIAAALRLAELDKQHARAIGAGRGESRNDEAARAQAGADLAAADREVKAITAALMEGHEAVVKSQSTARGRLRDEAQAPLRALVAQLAPALQVVETVGAEFVTATDAIRMLERGRGLGGAQLGDVLGVPVQSVVGRVPAILAAFRQYGLLPKRG